MDITVNGTTYHIAPHAQLQYVDLRGAHLRGADLQDAQLQYARLRGADLRGADLRYADLRGADLQDAQLQYARLPPLSILPDGDLVGWKKCRDDVVVKLSVPSDAARSNATGRKCRAARAVVLEVIGAETGVSIHDDSFRYTAGETVEVTDFDTDWTRECAAGIHFFITRAEAEAHA